jgi:hypothetical protein
LNNGRARDAADNMDVSENTQVRTPDLDEKSD